ncbi:hypothetical protein RI129_009706 [Pyrocoelia pectoralis]|uniref:Uncharacterized protein n=1 Tax=Pyrocoelia pectoralis TaxID=417401 RepID=A0AAN7VC43_9COLE
MGKKIVFWILTVSIIQVLSVDISNDNVDQSTKECMKELNIDEKVLPEIYDNKFHFVFENENTLKFLECCLRKIPFFNSRGDFNEEFAIDQLGKGIKLVAQGKIEDQKLPELSKAFFHMCKGEKGEILPKRMAKYHNCVMTEIDKHLS